MASSGAMADFARLPASRKVLIFVVIGMLLGLLYRQFFYKGLGDDVDDAENEQQAKTAQNNALEAQIKDYTQQQDEYAENIKKMQRNQRALPSEAELPAFLDTLGQRVRAAGIESFTFTPATEVPVDNFIKVPVQVELTGTFMQIKRFFASLAQDDITASGKPKEKTDSDEHDRIVSVEAMSIGQPFMKNGEVQLTAKFTATTFRQAEQALKPGQGSGAGSGAQPPPPLPPPPPPPPPAGSAKSQPSPNSPAGIGQKVQNNIDNAANKTREQSGVDGPKTPPSTSSGSGAGSARLKGGL
jgi:Tfp pilus assembly protein PilO